MTNLPTYTVKLGYNELGYNELGYNEHSLIRNKYNILVGLACFGALFIGYNEQNPGYNEQISSKNIIYLLIPLCSEGKYMF